MARVLQVGRYAPRRSGRKCTDSIQAFIAGGTAGVEEQEIDSIARPKRGASGLSLDARCLNSFFTIQAAAAAFRCLPRPGPHPLGQRASLRCSCSQRSANRAGTSSRTSQPSASYEGAPAWPRTCLQLIDDDDASAAGIHQRVNMRVFTPFPQQYISARRRIADDRSVI